MTAQPAARPASASRRVRAYVSRRRTGTALKLWITDQALAHLEASRSLSLDVLGEAPSRSVLMRLAARVLADTLHRISAETAAQRAKLGVHVPSPEVVMLKAALAECRGAVRR